MKKLLVLALVLSMASVASADLVFTGGNTVQEGSSIALSMVTDVEIPQGAYYFGIDIGSTGAGSLDISGAVVDYPGVPSIVFEEGDPDISEMLGLVSDYQASLTDTVTPIDPVIGTLVSNILFSGVTAGDVILDIFNGDGEMLSQLTVTVTGSTVPEPITIGLLGLGAMFLRRRK